MSEYILLKDTDLYDSVECKGMATQASRGRHFKVVGQQKITSATADEGVERPGPVQIRLCEDNYDAWLARLDDPSVCNSTTSPYERSSLSEEEVFVRMPLVLKNVEEAARKENVYMWGGTLGPDLDCSGLTQWAFAAAGVWIPRDAYQQRDFATPIEVSEARCGDLLFFGDTTKVDHVAMVTEQATLDSPHVGYTHSSGVTFGRNGVGKDLLVETEDPVGAHYARRFLSVGRIVKSVTDEYFTLAERDCSECQAKNHSDT